MIEIVNEFNTKYSEITALEQTRIGLIRELVTGLIGTAVWYLGSELNNIFTFEHEIEHEFHVSMGEYNKVMACHYGAFQDRIELRFDYTSHMFEWIVNYNIKVEIEPENSYNRRMVLKNYESLMKIFNGER